MYLVKICLLYWSKKMSIGQLSDRKYRLGNLRRILGRAKAESAVVTQTQRKQDENASLIKGTKPCG